MPRRGEWVEEDPSGNKKEYSFRAPVRKERINKSRKELEREAAEVLKKAGKVKCIAHNINRSPQDKFYTLPNRKKESYNSKTLNNKRTRSGTETPPEKPPRTLAVSNITSHSRPSVFDIFKKLEDQPKKSNLRRSVSDASNLKSKPNSRRERDDPDGGVRSDAEEIRINKRTLTKKQLSPIIELQQREDYFSNVHEPNKENKSIDGTNSNPKPPTRKKLKEIDRNQSSITDSLRKFIDEIDEELYNETGVRIVQQPEEKKSTPEVIIIDLDKAEQISKPKNSRATALGKKLKYLTARKTDNPTKFEKKSLNEKLKLEAGPTGSPTHNIQSTIKKIETGGSDTTEMIHSSQKPAEKLPLTKGRTVNTMVKRLSSDSSTSPPPKTNILVTPSFSVQHNNNQPFSYTRGVSPDKYTGNEPGSPVIYAQVVCANGATGPSKQTVHTVITSNVKKNAQHSDSDEGLGYEEHFNRKYSPLESPLGKNYDKRYHNELEQDDSFLEVEESQKMGTTYFSDYAYDEMFSDKERGRADGMDAKRRESLSESLDNNQKSDWSARRDLLESRINQKFNDKLSRISPPKHTSSYFAETTSKSYRNGSRSPVNFSGNYNSDKSSDRTADRFASGSKSRDYYGDRKDYVEYISNGQYVYEPKSMEYHSSNYRLSPETRRFETSHNRSNDRFGVKTNRQQRLMKERTIYQSNPEIYNRNHEPRIEDSYHDSLRRERRVYKSDRYLDHSESDRKDKFGDSGIENDIKRDSADNFRPGARRIYGVRTTESEDEGFASSLLIASERQHTEDALNINKSRGYDDYDAPYVRQSYDYKKRRSDYVPRERSIDDGSHYDPRIDKDFGIAKGTLQKKVERKPPKAEKKSSLEKVKQLFMGSSRKKKEKQSMVREEDLRSRYKEYRGSRENLEPPLTKIEKQDQQSSYNYRNRSRLPTPSPEPPKNGYTNHISNGHMSDSNTSHNSWFKSLDRLSRKKNRKDEKDANLTSAEDDMNPKLPPTKNLRFFGDSLRQRNNISRSQIDISNRDRISHSTRDLHNISEESRPSLTKNGTRRHNHKSMMNISESDRETNRSLKSTLKPPISPSHRSRDTSRRDERGRRSKNEVSSLESSTEGDSSQQSQQSQRSIVYLHAATVGDIPGPGYLRNSSRAASREELNSSKIQPRVKTLSRSFSMLAPWKPKHYRESMDIDYSQYTKSAPVPKNGKYEQKVTRNGASRNTSSSTLKKKAHETKRSNQNVSLLGNSRSRSKENISSSQNIKRSKEEPLRGSTSTLYKKKDRLPRENSRYSKEKDERKISSKSVSVESLGGYSRSSRRSREDPREISRSVSMPRDPEKSAGWFRMGRKSNKNIISQRL